MAKRILVVDDDPGVRKAFRYALSDEGYEVHSAASGPEALDDVRARKPDLVFLDLRLPDMDGIAVLRELRKEHPDIPVHIVTAYREDYFEQLRQAREQGLRFEVADKPLRDEQIRDIARGFLGEARLRLFYAGEPEKAQNLVKNIQAAFTRRGMAGNIELVDTLEQFERAVAENVFATPMLIRVCPEPERRVMGDLWDADNALRNLGFGS